MLFLICGGDYYLYFLDVTDTCSHLLNGSMLHSNPVNYCPSAFVSWKASVELSWLMLVLSGQNHTPRGLRYVVLTGANCKSCCAIFLSSVINNPSLIFRWSWLSMVKSWEEQFFSKYLLLNLLLLIRCVMNVTVKKLRISGMLWFVSCDSSFSRCLFLVNVCILIITLISGSS